MQKNSYLTSFRPRGAILYIVIFTVLLIVLWKCTTGYDYNWTSNLSKLHYKLSNKLQLPFDDQDYSQLMNLNNFSFSIFNSPCTASTTLLILVFSASGNFNARHVIRTTWGQGNSQIKILFIIGLVTDLHIQETIEEENEMYRDLIQGTFYDAYRNLTYKHIAALKYVLYHCPQTPYVLKADDDILVNIPAVIQFLDLYMAPLSKMKIIYCDVRRWSEPERINGKWAVSFEEYSDNRYPTYCLGWGILYTSNIILEIYTAAKNAKYFWIDDVFITGILAKELGLRHFDIRQWKINFAQINDIFNKRNMTKQSFLFGPIGIKSDGIKKLWNHVNHSYADYLNSGF